MMTNGHRYQHHTMTGRTTEIIYVYIICLVYILISYSIQNLFASFLHYV
jgi:hypothetical protein